MLEKKKFVNYTLDEDKTNKKGSVLSIKLNEKDEEMIEIGSYCFNIHSKGRVLKELAELGLKVILTNFSADKMHYLTRGDRTRLIHDKPNIKHFSKNVSDY